MVVLIKPIDVCSKLGCDRNPIRGYIPQEIVYGDESKESFVGIFCFKASQA
ncbi:MAG: hypothetical protein ACFCAD_26545 [Pleurocapsa sp.]